MTALTLTGVFVLWAGIGLASQEGEPETPGAPETPVSVDEFLRDPQVGDTVRVQLASGSSLEGTLISRRDGEVLVLVDRIEVRLTEEEVRRVVRLKSPIERFREMRTATGDRDQEGLLLLARWARDQGLLSEALGIVGEVLEFRPENREALNLNRNIAFLLKLKQDSGDPAPEDLTEERREELARLRITNFPYLTDEQVNLIKVYEVDLKDPPKMRIPDSALTTLFEEHAEHPLVPDTEAGRRAFRKLPEPEILDVMFRVQARELYPEVKIIGQVEQMRQFRDRINAGWLTRSCATTDCHGGLSGGRFILSNRWRRTERGVYTNFYILNAFETSDGLPMIDAEEPQLSAMLQMGLPRDLALWPHPEVVGWRPTFRSEEDRWFQRTVEWIEGLYQPRPEHTIDYVLPGDRPRDELQAPARTN